MLPSPLTVDVSDKLLTYCDVPRPCILDVKDISIPDVLTYPKDPRPCVVDIKEVSRPDVLTYDSIPRPCVVEVSDTLLTYPEVPRPSTVDTILPEFVPEKLASLASR
jgi:hypothetical protein